MQNYFQPGCQLEFTAAAAISSGDVVVVGDLAGVAAADYAIGEKAVMSVDGVFDLAPAAASVGALTNGVKAYWDTGAGEVVDAPGAGIVPLGYVFGADAVSGLVKVKLDSSLS